MLYKNLSFVGLCMGFFIVMMDLTTVPLIYTTLMNEFQISPGMVAWVNNSYLVTYAAFLLLGGRLGDFANRKTVVLAAYLALALGAAISGSGQSFTAVMGGRALMGVGAGLLTPQSMAYISILFAKGGRGAALGIWGAVAGVATATGPVVTQILLAMADWRWVMWINIPIALLCFAIAVVSLPSDPGRGMRLWDTAVSAAFGLCLAGIMVGVQLLSMFGPIRTLGASLILLGVAASVVLVWHELKKKHGYILSPDLWLDGAFLRICFISGLLGLAVTSFYLPLVFLLDVRMNFGPVAISTVMITAALSNALIGPFAGTFSDRMPAEKIVQLGLILFAVANTLLGLIGMFVPEGRWALWALCAAMVMVGAGTGLAFAPLANLALSRAQAATVGRAAAFFNSVRQVLSALGGVIIAIVFDAIVRSHLGRDLEVTAANLRESSDTTALASLGCFLLIAAALAVAAYASRRSTQPKLA